MAITTWTSENMIWPPAKGGVTSRYLHAIGLALRERADAAALSGGIWDTVDDTLAPGRLIVQPGGGDPDINYPGVYHSALSQLYAHYYNQTSGGGSWDGESSFPTWTEAAALSAIGAASRIAVPTPSTDLTPGATMRDWLHQTYQLLNLLVWTGGPVSYARQIRAASQIGNTNADIDTVWAATIAASYGAPAALNDVGAYAGFNSPYTVAAQYKLQITGSILAWQSTADVYLFAEAWGAGDTYDDQSEGYGEDVYTLLTSLSAGASHAHTVTPPDSPAPVYPATGSDLRGWSGSLHLVRKFDVDGGFNFLD